MRRTPRRAPGERVLHLAARDDERTNSTIQPAGFSAASLQDRGRLVMLTALLAIVGLASRVAKTPESVIEKTRRRIRTAAEASVSRSF